MRKREREVTDPQEKLAVLLGCPFLTLALHGEGAPYCVPLNFGAEEENGRLVLYFHCALEGTKLDLLRADGRVGFSAARMLRVFNKGIAPCGYTADYESVCGFGTARIVEEADARLHGLRVLMAHYTDESFPDESFLPRPLSLTAVVRVDVEAWTCKRLVRQ